jgi:hypothetical protein
LSAGVNMLFLDIDVEPLQACCDIPPGALAVVGEKPKRDPGPPRLVDKMVCSWNQVSTPLDDAIHIDRARDLGMACGPKAHETLMFGDGNVNAPLRYGRFSLSISSCRRRAAISVRFRRLSVFRNQAAPRGVEELTSVVQSDGDRSNRRRPSQ